VGCLAGELDLRERALARAQQGCARVGDRADHHCVALVRADETQLARLAADDFAHAHRAEQLALRQPSRASQADLLGGRAAQPERAGELAPAQPLGRGDLAKCVELHVGDAEAEQPAILERERARIAAGLGPARQRPGGHRVGVRDEEHAASRARRELVAIKPGAALRVAPFRNALDSTGAREQVCVLGFGRAVDRFAPREAPHRQARARVERLEHIERGAVAGGRDAVGPDERACALEKPVGKPHRRRS